MPLPNPMFSKFDQVLGTTTPTTGTPQVTSRADEIRAIAKQAQATPTQAPTTQTSSPLENVADFGKGFLKGAGRSLVNMSNLGRDVINTASGGATKQVFEAVDKKSNRPQLQQQLEPKNTAQRIGGYAETAAELAGPVVLGAAGGGKTLIKSAQSLYQRALKPSTAMSEIERSKVVQTGLKEGIRLTKGGIEKTADLIDNLESRLGKAIDEAGDAAGKIQTSALRPFVNEAKKFLGGTVDVKFSENATKQIDDIYNNFVKKYGTEVPVKIAQELKTNTYKILKSHYERLSAPTIEASKQLARGLKEGIVNVAPQVQNINQRLASLYNFEEALNKASGRIGNLNVISLGSKLMGGIGGKAGAVAAAFNEVLGRAGVKSIAAIEMNKLGNVLSKMAPEDVGVLYKILKGGAVATGANIQQGIKSIFNGSE